MPPAVFSEGIIGGSLYNAIDMTDCVLLCCSGSGCHDCCFFIKNLQNMCWSAHYRASKLLLWQEQDSLCNVTITDIMYNPSELFLQQSRHPSNSILNASGPFRSPRQQPGQLTIAGEAAFQRCMTIWQGSNWIGLWWAISAKKVAIPPGSHRGSRKTRIAASRGHLCIYCGRSLPFYNE